MKAPALRQVRDFALTHLRLTSRNICKVPGKQEVGLPAGSCQKKAKKFDNTWLDQFFDFIPDLNLNRQNRFDKYTLKFGRGKVLWVKTPDLKQEFHHNVSTRCY